MAGMLRRAYAAVVSEAKEQWFSLTHLDKRQV